LRNLNQFWKLPSNPMYLLHNTKKLYIYKLLKLIIQIYYYFIHYLFYYCIHVLHFSWFKKVLRILGINN
jgi:hypothetical protein